MTIDTEFIREKTYWPVLCLIQIGWPDGQACIDPKAGLDMAPFVKLLENPAVTKVLHSGGQDVEIFLHLYDIIPSPIFDTQIAAQMLGFGEAASYQSLVSSLCKVTLDKGQRFTDWSKRPLTDEQVQYALSDVTYLRDVYAKLKQRLEDAGRTDWAQEETRHAFTRQHYAVDYQRICHKMMPTRASARTAGALDALVKWRESKAMQLDRPRRHILTDEHIVALASVLPGDIQALEGVRVGVPSKMRQEVLDVIAAAPPAAKPAVRDDSAQSGRLRPIIQLLTVLLHIKAHDGKVAAKVIASSDDLHALAADDNADIPALGGWRRQIFGDDALALKRGELAFAYDPDGRRIVVRKEQAKE